MEQTVLLSSAWSRCYRWLPGEILYQGSGLNRSPSLHQWAASQELLQSTLGLTQEREKELMSHKRDFNGDNKMSFSHLKLHPGDLGASRGRCCLHRLCLAAHVPWCHIWLGQALQGLWG